MEGQAMTEPTSSEQRVQGPLGHWQSLLGLASLSCLLVFWGALFLRIVSTPQNHIGFSVLLALPLALVTLVAGGIGWAGGRRRLGLVLMLLGGLSLPGIIAIDRLNILVSYEAWLKRGMPERPF
jgi:hypothetical protein